MAKEEKKLKQENKHFFKDFKGELKKVIWPTPKQLVNNTIAVVTIVLITAAIVFVLDLAFGALNTYGVDKFKTNIKAKQQVVQENVTNNVEKNSEQDNNIEKTDVLEQQNTATE